MILYSLLCVSAWLWKKKIPHGQNINRKILERDQVDTSTTQTHDHLLSWLGTGILKKNKYNQICIKRSPLRKKKGLLRQVTS